MNAQEKIQVERIKQILLTLCEIQRNETQRNNFIIKEPGRNNKIEFKEKLKIFCSNLKGMII